VPKYAEGARKPWLALDSYKPQIHGGVPTAEDHGIALSTLTTAEKLTRKDERLVSEE
jgi:hypothetical protein